MFELDAFIIQGHQKVIDHYCRLRDSSTSAAERERFQRRMDQERDALNEYLEQRSGGGQRAA
jgi:hypothetical protein